MPKKILVVEDDIALLDILFTRLKSLGYSVIEASDGKQALTKFKKESPDLILLDILIPLKNGFEVLEEIKIKQKSHVPIIILTNLDEYQDVKKAKKLGAADYVIKSNLTIKELIAKVTKLLISTHAKQ